MRPGAVAGLSPQERGLRFEDYVAMLLQAYGKQNVRHDVEYHRERIGAKRQVDVAYDGFIQNASGRIQTVPIIVEVKYSLDGCVSSSPSSEHKRGQTLSKIENIVDELVERARFVHSPLAYLVTNAYFSKAMHERAQAYNLYEKNNPGAFGCAIEILEGEQMLALAKKAYGPGASLDNAMGLCTAPTRPNIIRLSR